MSGPAGCRRRPAKLPRPHLLWPAGGAAGLLAVLTVVAPAAFAATAPACGVAVLARSDSAGRTELLVAAPDLRSQIDLPASAFSVSSAGATVPVTVRRPAAGEQAVSVVLAASATTPAASYQSARGAALELLVGLQPGTSTGVVTTASATPLAPLSADPARATRSLQLARPGVTISAEAAVRLAGQGLPPGSHVVLFSDGTGDGALPDVQREFAQRRIVLDRVQYPSASRPAPAAGDSACVRPSDPPVRQVNHVLARVRGAYWVSAALAPSASAQLSVRDASSTSSTELPAAASSGPVLADPYRDRGVAGIRTTGPYVAAGALAVLGLLMAAGSRRRPPAVASPPATGPDTDRWQAPTSMARSRVDAQ